MKLEEAQDYELYKKRVKQRFGLAANHHMRKLKNLRNMKHTCS